MKTNMKENYFFHFIKYGLALLFFICAFTTFAQQATFTGKIVDENNQPLPGTTVRVKGSRQAVITDQNGVFKLSGDRQSTLSISISFVGYDVIETMINVNQPQTIQLQPNAKSLSEVVVVGYGTSKKSDLTAAVTNLGAKSLNPGPVTSPLQMLTGKAAGVSVVQVGSQPGTTPTIRIRGITSLRGGNDPLYVVDGVQGGSDLLTNIPSSEIESIDILKDAAATAIYGARGAAGVVIATTKRSKSGKTSVEYSEQTSIDVINKFLPMMSADQWSKEALVMGVPAASNFGANTDWYGLLTRNGTTQNHSLAIGGGTDNFNYRASLTAILQNGVVKATDNQRYIGKIQATQKAFDNNLTLTYNLSNSITKGNNGPGSLGRAAFTGNVISNTYIQRPTDPVYNANGTYFTDPNIFQYLNPVAANNNIVNESNNDNLSGSVTALLQLHKGLTVQWFGSWQKTDYNSGYYASPLSTKATAIDNKGEASVNDSHSDSKLTNVVLNYTVDLGKKHHLDATGVYEWSSSESNSSFENGRGFINDLALYNNLGLEDASKIQAGDVGSSRSSRNLVSFVGRAHYSFLGRYLLEGGIRRDGSSVFGANNKWGNFPHVSVGWKLAQEPFMKHQKIFTTLTLRGAYGVTGNQGVGPLGSLQLVSGSGTTYFNGAVQTNFRISQNGNPDLKWETKKQTDIGLDFSILKGRLSGTFDAFTAKTDNLLYSYTVPQPPFPTGSIQANVGSIQNRGLELSLSYTVFQTANATLTLAGNGTLLDNKVLNLNGTLDGVPLNTNYVGWGTNAYLITGRPIGQIKILHHLGVSATGVETVVDQNTDGKIDAGSQSLDRIYEGTTVPNYNFAFTPSFTYKNFDVSMVWRGSGGNKIYNSLRSSLSYLQNIGKSNLLQSAATTGINTSSYSSDMWLEDGSFIRWENLSFGYRMKTDRLKYINSLRFSLTGSNLLVFTKYTGIDPEVSSSGNSGDGSDGGIYPRVRTFSVGVYIVLK